MKIFLVQNFMLTLNLNIFCFSLGSALMSIVGVYKEIQDQHMNIVSIMKNDQKMVMNTAFDVHFSIFTIYS